MTRFDDRSSDVMRQAVIKGLYPLDNEHNQQFIDLLSRQLDGISTYKNTSLSELWQNPTTARIHEHYFHPYEQSEDLSPVLVEMARFDVPYGQTGIIKRIDTVLSDQRTDPPTYPAEPFSLLPDFYNVVFHLRLQSFTGRWDPRDLFTPIIPNIPGFAHPDLPRIQYLWYGTGDLNSSGGITLIVPQAHQLRLYAEIPQSQTHRITAIGRLRGYRQHTDSEAAQLNTQRGDPVL